MDYRKTAQDILDHVGGSKNIASAAHCATRLRLVIADNKKKNAICKDGIFTDICYSILCGLHEFCCF